MLKDVQNIRRSLEQLIQHRARDDALSVHLQVQEWLDESYPMVRLYKPQGIKVESTVNLPLFGCHWSKGACNSEISIRGQHLSDISFKRTMFVWEWNFSYSDNSQVLVYVSYSSENNKDDYFGITLLLGQWCHASPLDRSLLLISLGRLGFLNNMSLKYKLM